MCPTAILSPYGRSFLWYIWAAESHPVSLWVTPCCSLLVIIIFLSRFFNFLCSSLFRGVWHCRMWLGGSQSCVFWHSVWDAVGEHFQILGSCIVYWQRSSITVCLWALPVPVSDKCSAGVGTTGSCANTSVVHSSAANPCVSCANESSWAPRKMKCGKDTRKGKANPKAEPGWLCCFSPVTGQQWLSAALLGCGRISSWPWKTPDESGEDAECPQCPLERETVSNQAEISSQYLKHP